MEFYKSLLLIPDHLWPVGSIATFVFGDELEVIDPINKVVAFMPVCIFGIEGKKRRPEKQSACNTDGNITAITAVVGFDF